MTTIAIIGRPNVGKSTLFNRIAGRRLAIVDDTPGVTRDRKEYDVSWGDLSFRLIDTAGLEEAAAGSLEGRMRGQTEMAIAEADLCLFLIDARAGVTPLDEHFSAILRKSGKPVLLLANKCEGRAAQAGLMEAFALGLGEPIAVSAEHGEGIADLYQALRPFVEEGRDSGAAGMADQMDDHLDKDLDGDADERPTGPLRVAIVGRPNAGKSTLINRLIGEERLLTGPEAGITRDAIRIPWTWHDEPVLLYDTAGMRRKARVQERLEKLSVGDTLNAIKFAEVVVVLIDASQPFEKQDLQIADLISREGRAIVIAVNKWDQVGDKDATRKLLQEEVERLLPQVRGVALVQVSAKTGRGLPALMDAVFQAAEIWNRRIPTAALNRFLDAAIERNPPPAVSGRRIRLRYMTQPKSRPPTFVLFSQRAQSLPESYVRYLVNGLRDAFDLSGTPIRVHVRKGDNPYAPRK